jgi:ankyrin repeat protein
VFVKNGLYICFALLFLQSNCSQNSLVPSEDPFMPFIISAGVGTLATYCAPSKYLTINPNKLAMGGLGLCTAAGTYEIVKRSYPDSIKNIGIKLGLNIAKQESLRKLTPVVMGAGCGIAFGACLSMYYRNNFWNENIEGNTNDASRSLQFGCNILNQQGTITETVQRLPETGDTVSIVNNEGEPPLTAAYSEESNSHEGNILNQLSTINHTEPAQTLPETDDTVSIVNNERATLLTATTYSEESNSHEGNPLNQPSTISHTEPVTKYARVKFRNSPKKISLKEACAEGRLEIARELIAQGADVNAGINDRHDEYTPLMMAVSNRHTEIVKLLLENKAEVNIVGRTGTALMEAARYGSTEIARLLIENDADVDYTDLYCTMPALMLATLYGHTEIVQLLLENKANVDAATNDGKTALVLACSRGHLKIVELLIAAGADVHNVKNVKGMKPIVEACYEGHLEIVERLIAAGAPVNFSMDQYDMGYSSPLLQWASAPGHTEIVKLLLAAGAHVNDACAVSGDTALTLACSKGHLKIVKLLLAAGAHTYYACPSGDTALTLACKNGHRDIVELLVNAGSIIKFD